MDPRRYSEDEASGPTVVCRSRFGPSNSKNSSIFGIFPLFLPSLEPSAITLTIAGMKMLFKVYTYG
jgi:hypothetical protein